MPISRTTCTTPKDLRFCSFLSWIERTGRPSVRCAPTHLLRVFFARYFLDDQQLDDSSGSLVGAPRTPARSLWREPKLTKKPRCRPCSPSRSPFIHRDGFEGVDVRMAHLVHLLDLNRKPVIGE